MPAPIKDLTGKIFGKLTVLSFHHTDGHSYWNCMCECGKQTVVKGKTLSSGRTKSCGCLSTDITDLSGKKFGRWTVDGFSHRDNRTYWICRCDCGNVKTIVGYALLNGDSRSCGCFKKEVAGKASITHGLRLHPLYRVWSNMKNRCYNVATPRYPDWGGRGIKLCNEWLDFSVFYSWSICNGYQKGLTTELRPMANAVRQSRLERHVRLRKGEEVRYHAATGQFTIDAKALEMVALQIPYIIKQIRLTAGLPLDKYKNDGPLTPADHAMHAVLELADRIGIDMGARWGEEMDVRGAG